MSQLISKLISLCKFPVNKLSGKIEIPALIIHNFSIFRDSVVYFNFFKYILGPEISRFKFHELNMPAIIRLNRPN